MEGLNKPMPLMMKGNLSNNWNVFKMEFEIFLIASGHDEATDKIKVAIFKNLIGREAMDIMETMEIKCKDKMTIKDYMDAFDKYCTPKVNVLYERHLFYGRHQKDYESFDNFIKDLQKMIQTCAFEAAKDSMLRDRIVFGLRDLQLREKFIKEGNPKLEDVIDKCRIEERTSRQAQEILQQDLEVAVVRGMNINNFNKFNNKVNRNYTPINGNNGNNSREPSKGQNRDSQASSSQVRHRSGYKCVKCSGIHDRGTCPAYNKKCYRCEGKHHYARCCRSKSINEVDKDSGPVCDGDYDDHIVENGELYIDSVDNKLLHRDRGWFENLYVNECKIKFKIDTGSDVNILPLSIYERLEIKPEIHKTKIVLRAFGGTKITPYGLVELIVKFENARYVEAFIIVNSDVKPIIGLETIRKWKLMKNICDITKDSVSFIKANEQIFKGLGKFPDKLKLVLKEDAQPIARPPRRIPIAIKQKVKASLDKLEENGIIERLLEPTDWVSNMVVVQKPNGSLRICLDPKFLNNAIKQDFYEIPKLEDLTARLAGVTYFTVLDIKDGFYQIELEDESKKMCAFSTPFGTYNFKRLPFGINIAPETFQRLNEKNFGDIAGTLIYIDDVLVTGRSENEHDFNLEQVIKRAKQLNITFNPDKVQYKVNEVKFLGHVFGIDGIRCDPNRVKAITEMSNPTSKQELQRFLGMVNYMRNYIPNMAEITEPLRQLLKKNIEFCWLQSHEYCIKQLKELITQAPILQSFDVAKHIVIQTDASKNGIGCVLLQEQKPVAYASRSLNDTEKEYAQVEKEFLAIIYACVKFHNYIFGRSVEIHTDHKPLVGVMKNEIHKVNSSRLQRMKLKLCKYELIVKYKPGKELHIADHLSRSFLNDEPSNEFQEFEEIIHTINMSDEKKQKMIRETAKDESLSNLLKLYKDGWPNAKNKLNDVVKPFWKFKDDIYCEEGLVFLGERVIVPRSLRSEMLKVLHESHIGITKTKQRARQIIYWPGIDTDIENFIGNCRICEKFQNSNVKEPLISHEIPELPFNKIGCDIMQVGAEDYLVVSDYYSKWIEALPLQNKQASEVIINLKNVFATHGIPKVMICDNMPFASYEMDDFSKNWDFVIKTSSPTYPRSNGHAEKAVNIAKNLIKKAKEDKKDIQYALLEYRNHPVANLGASPSQLMFSRRTRTKVPIRESLFEPRVELNVIAKLKANQEKSKSYYDKQTKNRPNFADGQSVVYRKNNVWEPALIMKKHDNPRSLIIKNENGTLLRRNSFHLRKSHRYPQFKREFNDTSTDNESIRNCGERPNWSDRGRNGSLATLPNTNTSDTTRSGRIVRTPVRFKDFVRY